tara:strand:- start:2804 stop:3571 length:768 start_codon:yes stop_codon:yes gene_type:complete
MKNIVAIDVGNSETTVGVGNNLAWKSYRYTTRKTITSDELFMMFKTTIDPESINDENLDGSIICSVVPQITDSVIEATKRFTSKTVKNVGPGIKTGLKVNIDNPKELGPDRIANSVGGFKMAKKTVVIIDLGTATTFDIVNNKKEYLGGSIAPGIKISLEALTSKTSSLKSVEISNPKSVIGKNTYEAIQSGLILGHASMIDSMLEKIILEIDSEPKIIITGGLGEIIQPILNIETIYSKDLTLNGLEEIYFLNN